MLLIATDEAGYGPKLGPLVIAATTWQVPESAVTDELLSGLFESLGRPHQVNGTQVVVNDSKAVFKPKSSSKPNQDALAGLHATVSAAMQWIAMNQSSAKDCPTFLDWIAHVALSDIDVIKQTAWLNQSDDRPFESGDDVNAVIEKWSSQGVKLCNALLRVVPAAMFNAKCDSGYNKADLLSESTIGLVRDSINAARDSEPIVVRIFCDRHGGRRYYAGVLQHLFSEATVQVVDESKTESKYRIVEPGVDATIAFTVKGDRFPPVALSSILAKYTRERMMQAFNAYFAGLAGDGQPLKPTAGYPVDADRFLADIAKIIKAEGISQNDLVRQR